MNIQLITALPAWWIIICFLSGLLCAYILYRRDNSFDNIHVWLKRVLFILRTIVVFFLSVLLLTPLIKTLISEKEKPIIIVAQDNSESIILNKDSSFYKNGYKSAVNNLVNDLKEKFDVHTISWGDNIHDELNFNYNEKQTDFSQLQNQLSVRFGNRNVGALIIASDGLYNRGSSPLYDEQLKIPVYTIALGDTTVQKDVFISKVDFNKTVYLGNSFPVEITVNARQCNGSVTTLSVTQDSLQVFSKTIAISGNRFSQLVPALMDAKKTGTIHYKIKVSSVAGEMTTVNNEKDIYIEVVESRQKILIIGNAPHPDLGALKNGIESSQNYTVKTILAGDNFQINEYNLVILHNLPSQLHPVNEILSQIKSTGTPVLFITGSQTSVNLFNNFQAGITIAGSGERTNLVQARVNQNFSHFTVSDDFRKEIPLFPPLLSPFGQFTETTDNAVLLQQKIGTVSTESPLQTFNDNGKSRIGVICGEGVWRWRLTDYSDNGNFNVFQEWLIKTVQNLSVKENKTHFRLINKNTFAENEPVTFDAEVYNDNYELINTSDVNINFINSDNKSFPYTFSKNDRGYTLNAGFLATGKYRYKATVNSGGKVYQNTGEITVTELQAERSETVADHQLMFALAKKTGGEMYYPDQMKQLSEKLLQRNDIKTITYSHYKLRDLIEWKFIFFLIAGMLSIEWFLRKRAGGY